VQDIFISAKNKVLDDFSCPIVHRRIRHVRSRIVPQHVMSSNLNGDNYRRKRSIPAYYDPNIHTVFLNDTALTGYDDTTLFVICYHELVHSASLHISYNLAALNVFQSGIKFERYYQTDYKCFNRLLNEGIVQYFTTANNGFDYTNFGYPREVALVVTLATDLGSVCIKNALLYEDYPQFKVRFEAIYGHESFAHFTELLDNRDYVGAQSILKNKLEISPIPASPSLQPAFSAAYAV